MRYLWLTYRHEHLRNQQGEGRHPSPILRVSRVALERSKQRGTDNGDLLHVRDEARKVAKVTTAQVITINMTNRWALHRAHL